MVLGAEQRSLYHKSAMANLNAGGWIVSNPAPFQIMVKGNVKGGPLSANIPIAHDEQSFHATTIRRLKGLVLEHYFGVSSYRKSDKVLDGIGLQHCGKQLYISTSKEMTLRDYGITTDSNIYMVARIAGGGSGKYMYIYM